MALCLQLPLQLHPVSKHLYSRCCQYLLQSSLRSIRKKNGRNYCSSGRASFEERGKTDGAPKVGNGKLEEMFVDVAQSVYGPYLALLRDLTGNIPSPPSLWQLNCGWTCYSASGPVSVEFPADDALVFDVEVCVREGFSPTIAAAVSPKAWYLWVSPRLMNAVEGIEQSAFSLDDLIPLGASPSSRITVGHFISYDRARVREEYCSLQGTGMRFFDTLSAHVRVSGVTNTQRKLMFSSLSKSDKWRKLTAPNSLGDLSEFYCGVTLNKTKRDTFVNGSLDDIAKDFQLLSSYCAEDVIATHRVLCKLLPLFLDRHPHLVSLAGMLELSTPLLPVTKDWGENVSNAEWLAGELRKRQVQLMTERAKECLALATNEQYRSDPWMWDLNWKPEPFRSGKWPSWYKVFSVGCEKSRNDSTSAAYLGLAVPKILGWRCGPFPLHYMPRLGWGVIVPEHMFVGQVTNYLEDELPPVPVRQIQQLCQDCAEDVCPIRTLSVSSLMETQEDDLYWREMSFTKSESEEVGVSESEANESVHELLISENTVFRRLYNVGGSGAVKKPVGISMSKSLMALNSPQAEGKEFLKIHHQLVPWLTHWSRWTKQHFVKPGASEVMGAILPQVQVCADYLSLPKDRAWTPLLSLQPDQVGANLAECVVAPPNHSFVCVSFDNLDLWFASLFGDAVEGSRGSTKFSASFLSGTLFDEMAAALKISAPEAKCFCHAVVAGADTYMVSKLILQTRVNTSRDEAFQQACRVMDLLVDYGLLSASPDLWPHIDADEMRSPLLGSRMSRPLEFEKKRVRFRAQWLIHSSKADFLHLFITYHRSLSLESRLCFVYGDVRCLYLVPEQYLGENSFKLAHEAVESFCLSRLRLDSTRTEPRAILAAAVNRRFGEANKEIDRILTERN